MALGYCKLCEKLLPIVQRGYKHAGSRERWWFPVEHTDQDGKICDGDKKGL